MFRVLGIAYICIGIALALLHPRPSALDRLTETKVGKGCEISGHATIVALLWPYYVQYFCYGGGYGACINSLSR